MNIYIIQILSLVHMLRTGNSHCERSNVPRHRCVFPRFFSHASLERRNIQKSGAIPVFHLNQSLAIIKNFSGSHAPRGSLYLERSSVPRRWSVFPCIPTHSVGTRKSTFYTPISEMRTSSQKIIKETQSLDDNLSDKSKNPFNFSGNANILFAAHSIQVRCTGF